MVYFEVFEGKEANAKMEFCEEQKKKLGSNGPWKSVALTKRMLIRFASSGRVVIADSWFGSVACVKMLFSISLFAVMMVKTAHKGYPKDVLLDLLGARKALIWAAGLYSIYVISFPVALIVPPSMPGLGAHGGTFDRVVACGRVCGR